MPLLANEMRRLSSNRPLRLLALGSLRPFYEDIFSAVVRRRGIWQRTWDSVLCTYGCLWLPSGGQRALRSTHLSFDIVGEAAFDGEAALGVFAGGRRRPGGLETLFGLSQASFELFELLGVGCYGLLPGERGQLCAAGTTR
jgi:hypothetical protein